MKADQAKEDARRLGAPPPDFVTNLQSFILSAQRDRICLHET